MSEEKSECKFGEVDEFDRLIRAIIKRCSAQDDPDGFNSISDEEIKYSVRHRIRMNRLFRERIRSSFLPFPEVDNFYERARSKVVVKLKINEFIDRRKRSK